MKTIIEGKITKIVKIDSGGTKFILTGNIDTPELPKIENQNVYVKVYNKYENLYAGTDVRFNGKLRLAKPKILPNEFDEELYLAGNDIQWVATAYKLSWNTATYDLYYLRDIISRNIKSVAAKVFSHNQNYIVQALLLGDKSEIPPEIKQIYSLSGTAHVLALSGLHIGLIAFIIFTFLGFVRNRATKFALYSIALIAFVFLSGLQPSAIRAAMMAILIVYARLFEKQFNLLNILSVVVLVSIAYDPSLILSIGFQMSVAAILGIAILFLPTRSMLDTLLPSKSVSLEYIKSSFAVTASASAIVSPLVAYYFGIFSIVSYLSNLFVIPIISLALSFSIISLLLSQIFMPLALIFGDATTFLLLLSEKINQISINIPYSFLEGNISILLSIFSFIFIVYLIFASSKKHLLFRAVGGIIGLLIMMNYQTELPENEVKIFPRQQAVVTVVPLERSRTLVYVADRKPSQLAQNDYALDNYISSIENSLYLAVNGNFGINTADKLREKISFEYIELSPDFQNKLNLRIFGNRKLSQIIEY